MSFHHGAHFLHWVFSRRRIFLPCSMLVRRLSPGVHPPTSEYGEQIVVFLRISRGRIFLERDWTPFPLGRPLSQVGQSRNQPTRPILTMDNYLSPLFYVSARERCAPPFTFFLFSSPPPQSLASLPLLNVYSRRSRVSMLAHVMSHGRVPRCSLLINAI